MAISISRKPMPERDSVILKRNFTYLERNIHASHLLTSLFELVIIDDEDMTRIENIVGRTAQNTALLRTLLYRGNEAWSAFIAALRKNGYEEVANGLFFPNNNNDSVPINNVSSMVSSSSDDEIANIPSPAVYENSYREIGETSERILSVRTPANVDLQEQSRTVCLENKITELETQLQTLNTILDENAQLKDELTEKDQTITENGKTIETLNQTIASLKDEIEQLQTDKENQTQKIEDLENRVETFQDEVNSRLLQLENRVDGGQSGGQSLTVPLTVPQRHESKLCVIS